MFHSHLILTLTHKTQPLALHGHSHTQERETERDPSHQ